MFRNLYVWKIRNVSVSLYNRCIHGHYITSTQLCNTLLITLLGGVTNRDVIWWGGQGGMECLLPWFWKIVTFCVFANKILYFSYFAPLSKSVKILPPLEKNGNESLVTKVSKACTVVRTQNLRITSEATYQFGHHCSFLILLI